MKLGQVVEPSLALLIAVCVQTTWANEKCYKDKTLGDREENVYYCTTEELPTCCVKEGGPTCCLDETDKNVKEQLQLWGTVGGMLLLIGILFVCCKNDISFCKSEKSLKERWQDFRNRKNNKHQQMKSDARESEYYDNPIGGFEKGGGHGLDPYHFPPLPPRHNNLQPNY